MTENSLQIFDSPEFGEVRAVEINGEPWFVGKDICAVFGDTNYRRSLSRLDNCEKTTVPIITSGGLQEMTVINESGLYSVLFYMQPQKAKGVSQNDTLIDERIEKLRKFKHWVTSEVLPSIRKHGLYATDDVLKATLENPEYIIGVLQRYQEEREKNKKLRVENSELRVDKQILQPKADYYDELVDRETLTSLTETAKELGFKPRTFTGYLVEHKYLYRTKDRRLLPIQRHVDNGLFVLKECANEKTKWSGTQTLVTVKGRDIFRSLDLQILKP